jgi:DNA primase
VAVVPAPHDPDSYIKAAGGEAFRQLIADADDFFDYHLKRLCRLNDVSSDKGRLVVLREMAEAIHKTGNAVLVDNYAQKTALRLAVNPDAVRAEFRKLAKARTASPEPQDEAPPPETAESAPPPSPHETQLLKLLLRHEAAAEWLDEQLDVEWLQHETVRTIVSARLQAHRESSWTGVAGFLDQFEDPRAQAFISEAATDNRPLPNPTQQLVDVTMRLRSRALDRAMVACAQRAAFPETSEEERLELLRQQQVLREQKKAPLPLPGGLPN